MSASGSTATSQLTNFTYNNESSCDVYNHHFAAKVIFSFFYTVLLVFGSCGNILALYVTFLRGKKINSTDLYLINLAVSDALFTLALPGRIAYYILEFNWPFGDWFCRVTAFIFYMNTYVGIYFMTCVSVDRYIAVVHTRRFGRFRKVSRVKYICMLVWFIQSCLAQKAFKMSLQITVAFMNMNCCIDPIIYFFAFRGYKSRLLRLFKTSGSTPSSSTGKSYSESNSNSHNQGACSSSA
uniref:G-protein coupled receptors family 1 profile domain-containing protein n=1 Tax=Pelusios castaneus TaxID=367368 RepID=A0A8C8SQU3_9SAUR